MAASIPEIWRDPALSIAETVLQQQLDKNAPALSQIPLLSIAIAAYKSKGAISDYLLARKVQQFYSAWERLDEPERQQVYQKFQKKPKAFVEKLLLLLQQQEDFEKCRLIGVLTTMFLQDQLKRKQYLDFIETVTHLSMGDLARLSKLANKGLIFAEKEVGERYAVLFVTRGLMATELPLPEEQRVEEPHAFYRITPVGLTFIECLGERA